jgi:ABC-type multidrug transport system ATPase subunit
VLQEDSLFPWLTVEGNLACVPMWAGIRNCPESVRPLIPFVEPLFKQRACDLSFGQRRIVELFRMLAFAGPLICLDEPFNFLDREKRSVVASVIDSLAKKGTCFVVSSHYHDDFEKWESAIYRFDGDLPVKSLEKMTI